MEAIRISDNLELAFNDAMTEVSINRTDGTGGCFIDIVVIDGKLVLDYCDHDQWDCEGDNPMGVRRHIRQWYKDRGEEIPW